MPAAKEQRPNKEGLKIRNKARQEHRKDNLQFAWRPLTVNFKVGFSASDHWHPQLLISPITNQLIPSNSPSLPLARRWPAALSILRTLRNYFMYFFCASFYFFLPPAGSVPRNAPSNAALNSSPIVSNRLFLLPGPLLFVCNSVVFFTSRFGFPDCSDFLPFSRKRRRLWPPWLSSWSPAEAVLPRF